MKYGVVICGPDIEYGPLALFSGTFEEKVKKASDSGFHGIELMVRDPKNLNWDLVKQIVQDANIEVPQIVTGELFGTDGLCLVTEDLNVRLNAGIRVRSVIDLAAHLGSMINIGRLRGRLDFLGNVNDPWHLALEYLRPIFDYAAEKNVRIALEPINRYETDFIHTSDEGVKLISDLGLENVGLMLDTFHMNIEERSIIKGLEMAGEKLWHVHIADSNRNYPGSGHIDFTPIIDTLEKMNYKGYVSAELLPLPDPDTAAGKTIEFPMCPKRSITSNRRTLCTKKGKFRLLCPPCFIPIALDLHPKRRL